MSTYGTYINGEDPNKKKEPVLSYEGFVGTGTASNAYQQGSGVVNNLYNTAINAANANKQAGINYAAGVKGSAYASAENLRKQTDANTEIARQRGVVDSNSSYQRAIGAYGANAESLGNLGLGASGYGEYLNANAYATHRGQVQDINANALAANRESAYLEAQSKATADSEYLKNLYGIQSEYNTAKNAAETDKIKGLYELGVGLDTAREEAYNSLVTAIEDGASLDTVKQSGAWGDLTPEQQNAISNRFYSGGLNYLINEESAAEKAYSKADAERVLKLAGYADADVAQIIASWQEGNYKELSNDTTLTESEIAENEKAGTISAEQAKELRAKLPKTANTGNNTTTVVKAPTDISEFGTAIVGNARWDGSRWVYPGASALSNQVYADTATRDKLNQAYPDAQQGFMVRVPGPERDVVYIRSGTGWLMDAAERVGSGSSSTSSGSSSDPFQKAMAGKT